MASGQENPSGTKAVSPLGATVAEKYEILEKLAESENGVSYKARELLSQGLFVVKFLTPSIKNEAARLDMMKYAAKYAAALSSPNMIPNLEFGEDPQFGFYLIREFVEGRTIGSLIKEKGVFNQIEFFDTFQQALKGLAYLHRKGFQHGNLSNKNIIVTDDFVVKIVDCGITRKNETSSKTLATAGAGVVRGDPAYMSPEQCKGEAFDIRSDIYSMACIMYEALSGCPPFGEGQNPTQTRMAHVQDKASPFMSLVPARKVDEQLETIIFRCLEKEGNNRYQTLDALQTDLRRIEEGEKIKPLDLSHGVGSSVKIALLLAVILLGLGSFAYYLYLQKAKDSETKVERKLVSQEQKATLLKEESQADDLYKKNNFFEASELYNKIEPAFSQAFGGESREHVRLLHKLARAQLWNEDVNEARVSYLVMMEILKRHPELLPKQYKPQAEIYSVAKEQFRKGRLATAGDAFNLAFRIDNEYYDEKTPLRYQILVWVGKAEAAQGNFKPAIKTLQRALDVIRDSLDDPEGLSFALLEYGRALTSSVDGPSDGHREEKVLKKAEQSLKEALKIRQELQDQKGASEVEEALAKLESRRKELAEMAR